jgi:uncharacterized sulfatase
MKSAGTAGIASAVAPAYKATSNPATKPNVPVLKKSATLEPRQVVVILGESVRYDMLNCNKQTGLKTPNLDRIAAEGMRFERAYNCQPVCSPARSAVWTGTFPHTNGVWGNSMQLGADQHTIGQRLTDQGIHCAFMGKWHLSGRDYFDSGIAPPGWDPAYWYDMRTFLQELSPEDRLRSRQPSTSQDPSWPVEKCYAHRVSNRAIDFLDNNRGKDFLMCVAYDEPHHPFVSPVAYSEMYKDYEFPGGPDLDDPLTDKPSSQRLWGARSLKNGSHPVKNPDYFGAHTFCDAEIGRILDKIQQVAPNALVIYTADHGTFQGSHHLADKGPAMYEEITHVPFLAKWPGQVPANTVCSNLVSHVDIAGTLMEFFGFEVPKTIEGKSFLPMLKNPKQPIRSEVFIEFGRFEIGLDGLGGFQPIRCICDGRYKLAVNVMVTDELYDLQSDPHEMHNLINSSEHKVIRDSLHDRLIDWMAQTRDPFRGYYWGQRPWRPDYVASWKGQGMMRNDEYDGYLPLELEYETGLNITQVVKGKP